jgi:hypothetical protein
LQGKFDHHEELVEAFGDDPAAVGAAVAKKKLDKFEERLIAAKLRLDGAYNKFTATVESKNKTVASIAKASGSSQGTSSASHPKEKDTTFLKRKLKEPYEWKDHADKTHVKHLNAFTTCKSMFVLLWRLLDKHMENMQDNGDEDATAKDVKFSELLTHSDLMDKLDNVSVREVLEYALNTVHEQSVVIYLSHHYNHDVLNAFTGDKLYMVGQSLPTKERIDAAVKRVQKMTPSARAAIAPPGAKQGEGPAPGGRGGGNKKTRKGGWQNGQQQHQPH